MFVKITKLSRNPQTRSNELKQCGFLQFLRKVIFTIRLEILLCEKYSAIKLRFSRFHLFAYQASLVQNFAPLWVSFIYYFEIIVTYTSLKLTTKLNTHLFTIRSGKRKSLGENFLCFFVFYFLFSLFIRVYLVLIISKNK